MNAELERLFFIACRGGIGEAMDFAQRTLAQYRKALSTPNHFSKLPHYRHSFEASIKTFEALLDGRIML